MAHPRVYNVSHEMQRLSDALHGYAKDLRADGDVDHAVACYDLAKRLVEVAVKYEQGTVGAPGVRGAMAMIEHRSRLTDAKRKQREAVTVTATRVDDEDEEERVH